MARSCGIRIGPRRVDVVLLDGSAKKPKVSLSTSRELEPGEEMADVLREVTREHKVPGDNVALVVDGASAAYRLLNLPFEDKSKIEQVIKYEVESELPQWNIDDVVVDFHPLVSNGVETTSLVTAVPKTVISDAVALATQVGLEPLEVELDGTALVNAADYAGQLTDSSGSVLVYVGEYSTTIAVVEGGQVRLMRAIRAGALVREAAPSADAETVDPEGSEGAEEPAKVATEAPDDSARLAALAKRLEREIVRTIAGSQGGDALEVVLISGYDVPGLPKTILDVPVERLRLFPEGDAADEPSVVAFGAALRQLGGGVLHPSLRREELRYSGTLERLELPLAVLMIAVFFFLFVQVLVLNQRLGWRDKPFLSNPLSKSEMPPDGDLQIWLKASNSYLLKQNLVDAPDEIRKYVMDAEAGRDDSRTKFEQLQQIRTRLRLTRDTLDRELGNDADIDQPQSALEGLAQVLGVLDELGDAVGRFSVRKLNASLAPGSRKGSSTDRIEVQLSLSFFADGSLEASRNYRAFKNSLSEKPWVIEVPDKGTDTLEGGQGIYVDNFKVLVDVSKIRRDQRRAAATATL